MIKFLLFPHSLHKRLSNLLNCICMLIEMNQLSGLCGTAAAYGHLLLWLCLMPWGQQKALVATGLHSPCPSVHLQPPACRQWPCLCFREGRRRAGSHDLLADEGRSLEGPPGEVVREGRRVTGLGVTVPTVGRWRAGAGEVVNVLHGGSFSAVAVFWMPESSSFCRGHPAASREDGQ